jgi:hypothetical protein
MPTLALHAFLAVLSLLRPHGLTLTAQHFVRVVALARAERDGPACALKNTRTYQSRCRSLH